MPIRVKSRVPLIFEAVEAETINIEDTKESKAPEPGTWSLSEDETNEEA